MSGIRKRWIAPVLGISLLGSVSGCSTAMNLGAAPKCYTVGPVDSREYQKPVCEDQSGLANLDTFAKMLNHFGVVLPENADGLRFQVEDYSAWNSGTMLTLYLHFTVSAQGAATLVKDLGATPSTKAYGQGSPPDEMQLNSSWDEIAQYTTQFGSSPEYARIHPYIWSLGAAGGAVFVDDTSDPSDPSVFVTSSIASY
jgi:hypothetical protein